LFLFNILSKSWRRRKKEAGELHDDLQKYRLNTEGPSCAIVWLGGRLEGRFEDQVGGGEDTAMISFQFLDGVLPGDGRDGGGVGDGGRGASQHELRLG
jgi:hypothetical protein